MKRLLILTSLFLFSFQAFAINASKNGDWIAMGVPQYVHVGTQGVFLINGNGTHGTCAGQTPRYFSFDMNAPHFYAMYSWLMHMSKENKAVACVVKSGCGTNTIQVEYCRGSLR
ncbi:MULTISPECIES: hypothetical protein [Vibrio]|uniref:hypothetical protein n=1 Tax=Vibrio TaxID=662 RepID=UPI002075FC2E|nr:MULTISPECIES: hypothetical protein [Vibrio]USD32802.1 hypothetical protein J8Z27_01360 [Vibrio sp. SCSIO 43186]USD45842.1 hypothetical protein J4N38_01360 [Vibrio sp. SCSIO 43145]USD69927.1 hypothetical protein J4N41_01360 [Vibrio sp. SCSIO 43139]USD94833.1 hypothetical protein CTT30_01390 [Vibrio coralliilyticus]